jgi:hypothetical protein
MKLRPTPALVVAVLALVVALGGTSYAAATIGSAQIKNNSVKGKDIKDGSLTGKDVKDGSLTGADVADGSLTRADLPARTCAADQFRIGADCLIKATRAVGTLNSAINDCNSISGRLPTLEELRTLPSSTALASGVTWTGGALNNYEFSSEFVDDGGLRVVASDFSGNTLFEDGTTPRGHHCVVPMS